MQALKEVPLITVEEYLAREREADYKSEYFNGEIFAMAGALEPHNLITGNVLGELHAQLKPRPCRVYPSDMRLKVSATGLYTYSDVMVVCGEVQFDDDEFDTLLNPTVIIEVLSKSTESHDRITKFEHYSKLKSLREYLLVAQNRPRAELFIKEGEGRWAFLTFENLEDVVKLASIDCELALKDIYLKVNFNEADVPRLREPIQKVR
ncbi:MAG: Uma2 family endonuclease [bacterium]